MTLALITPPDYEATPVVSLDAAKAHLVVEHAEHDQLIAQLINAAVRQLDAPNGPARALRPQTWELRLDQFPCGAIELPFPPLIDVVSVKYLDANGADTTLAAETGYRLFGAGVDTSKALLVPPYGASWPSARCDHESVRIRWTCGYPLEVKEDDVVLPDRLPPTIVAFALLLVGSLYEHRESAAAGANEVKELPPHIMQMCTEFRIF